MLFNASIIFSWTFFQSLDFSESWTLSCASKNDSIHLPIFMPLFFYLWNILFMNVRVLIYVSPFVTEESGSSLRSRFLYIKEACMIINIMWNSPRDLALIILTWLVGHVPYFIKIIIWHAGAATLHCLHCTFFTTTKILLQIDL